jgi:hypothetical protein
MKAPKSLFDRPGRATAVVGAVVAVSATAAVALLSGTAAATPDAGQAGKCTKNVNVRAEPDTTSRIVALCEEGTAVQVGESRDGFLRLTNLGGWAAQEYVSVNGRAPASAQRSSTSEGDDAEDESGRRSGRATDDARESGRAGHHGRHGSQGGHGTDGSGSGSSSGPSRSGADESSTDESSTDESGESTDPAETDESDESEAPGERPAPRPGGGIGGLLG